MADPKQTQEPTLLRVLDQLKMSNELVTGHSVKTSRMFETEFKEERKNRSDVGKHHKKRDKVEYVLSSLLIIFIKVFFASSFFSFFK